MALIDHTIQKTVYSIISHHTQPAQAVTH